ncbi:PP2C family protein-serine/threonine phosphatase [Noviherbaspirillum galbum]|uniref:SpoIIE family protein phosphatase n=1 Tax=Noviherbaspirillum galbum TaxID=2709383 RepID=A0A6B3SJR5_9BURK|nr:SpoIIE family protein phosphatase [Noviherbaspirillum galbum]NEX59595.1 SpoIIE family protein phosphatase [Noviherbaspirillum galbum]
MNTAPIPEDIDPSLPAFVHGRRRRDQFSFPGTNSGTRVLLVDDQRLVAAALKKMLEGAKEIELFAVTNAADAMEAIISFRPTVILQDLFMPDADGLALVHRYRNMEEASAVPVLVLSSEEDPNTKAMAFSRGANDYLIKLPAAAEMIARIRYHSAAYQHHLERDAAYRQLSRELEMARSMQLGLLPEPARLGAVRFEWLFQASSYVGGDCFDYFMVGDRHVCFYLADISGHGVSAAMLAFSLQHQMRAATHRMTRLVTETTSDIGRAAEIVMQDVNQRFLRMPDTSLYLTLAFGLIEQDTGLAAVATAGHPPALVTAMPGGDIIHAGVPGVPIGILRDPEFEASTVKLEPGSRIFLYSDGITETENARHEAFGQQRLEALLTNKEMHGRPLAHVRQALGDTLRAWRGARHSFEDDVTFLAMEFGIAGK